MFARRRSCSSARPTGSERSPSGRPDRPRDLANLVERTVGTFGGIDILVNNGGGPPPGPAARDRRRRRSRTRSTRSSSPRPADQPLPAPPEASKAGADHQHQLELRARADRQPRALERPPPRPGRLDEDARPRARPRGDHRQLDRARPDRHRAARQLYETRSARPTCPDPARPPRHRAEIAAVVCLPRLRRAPATSPAR